MSTRDEHRAEKERDFQQFLSRPDTKMMLSLVPPSEPPEALQTLLRAAFESGVGSGMSYVMLPLLGAILQPRKEER